MAKVEYSADDGFIRISRADSWPRYMLHAKECPVARRSKYGSKQDFEAVARDLSIPHHRTETHESCVPVHGALWTAIHKRSGEIARDRGLAERRARLLRSLAIIKVAASRIEAEVGTLTDEETVAYRDWSARLMNLTEVGGLHRVFADAATDLHPTKAVQA